LLFPFLIPKPDICDRSSVFVTGGGGFEEDLRSRWKHSCPVSTSTASRILEIRAGQEFCDEAFGGFAFRAAIARPFRINNISDNDVAK